jgi:hypothetical protein
MEMHRRFHAKIRIAGLYGSALALGTIGCGGQAHFGAQAPITVNLPISTVIVMPAGSSVIVPIQIGSTSETALVSFNGLPGGVQERYAASDTNPSGSLTFTAVSSAKTGTYMPMVVVSSAGQTAITQFTLIVRAM